MQVTRLQIVARGISNRCPNCGGKTLFKPGTLFQVNAACPDCGLVIERDEGSFLGAVALNFGTTVVVFLVPVLLLYLGGVFSGTTAAVVARISARLIVSSHTVPAAALPGQRTMNGTRKPPSQM